jgi:glycosyltransferase involved in cell wall biosynthesis
MMNYYKDMDLIITVSQYNKDHLPKGVQERTEVVHPCLDMKPFGRAGGVDCLFIGDIHERVKRVDRSIRLFKKTFGNGHKVCFHLVGPGVKKIGERKNLYYWGRLPHSEMRKIVLGSKFYIHWGDGDPHPVTVMEAMANGVIPITSPKIGNHYLTQEILDGVGSCETMDEAIKVMRMIDADDDLCEELRSKCIQMSKMFKPECTMENFCFWVNSRYDDWLKRQ